MHYFAHNGIHHATEAEAAAHESGAIIWVPLAFIFVAALLFAVNKLLRKRSRGKKS